jgi:hypothetical protein
MNIMTTKMGHTRIRRRVCGRLGVLGRKCIDIGPISYFRSRAATFDIHKKPRLSNRAMDLEPVFLKNCPNESGRSMLFESEFGMTMQVPSDRDQEAIKLICGSAGFV